jgi:hypothetical protein
MKTIKKLFLGLMLALTVCMAGATETCTNSDSGTMTPPGDWCETTATCSTYVAGPPLGITYCCRELRMGYAYWTGPNGETCGWNIVEPWQDPDGGWHYYPDHFTAPILYWRTIQSIVWYAVSHYIPRPGHSPFYWYDCVSLA